MQSTSAVAGVRSAEFLLLPLQKKQAEHDERAHKDILALDTQTRVKHMVLHFLKYIGKIVDSKRKSDMEGLRCTLIDTLIITLATANALNVSLGEGLGEAENLEQLGEKLAAKVRVSDTDLFGSAIDLLASPAGRMAKAVESSDHWESGNHRAELERLIVDFAMVVLALLNKTSTTAISRRVTSRWTDVESKNIFWRLNTTGLR